MKNLIMEPTQCFFLHRTSTEGSNGEIKGMTGFLSRVCIGQLTSERSTGTDRVCAMSLYSNFVRNEKQVPNKHWGQQSSELRCNFGAG